jgi:hypothetical protein
LDVNHFPIGKLLTTAKNYPLPRDDWIEIHDAAYETLWNQGNHLAAAMVTQVMLEIFGVPDELANPKAKKQE